LDDINIRFDRRINELTEMHRLTEERFRQEWISFKTDDQKRWTNYLLTQEEQQQEGSGCALRPLNASPDRGRGSGNERFARIDH
jgi:hypothetical protein